MVMADKGPPEDDRGPDEGPQPDEEYRQDEAAEEEAGPTDGSLTPAGEGAKLRNQAGEKLGFAQSGTGAWKGDCPECGARNAMWVTLGGFRCRECEWKGTDQQELISYSKPPTTAVGARVRCMADVPPEEVEWLWGARIPRGKLSEIVGDPGVGKSTLTTEIVACVTTGRALPGDDRFDPSPQPTNVLLLSAEDGAGDTIRPRLDRAKADVSRVHLFDGIGRPDGGVDPFDLREPSHRQYLAELIKDLDVGLLVIDPLNAYLGGVDTHRDADVRGVLAPLAEIAESTGCAILVIRHLNKGSGGRAIYRAGGSIGFTAAVRSSMLVGQVDEESDERAIVVIKSNLAGFPPPVGFSLEDGRFMWTGTPNVVASDLLRPESDSDERTDRTETVAWLIDVLEAGPIPSDELFERANAELSVSKATVKRAKRSLGDAVKASRESLGNTGAGRWIWELTARVSRPADPLGDLEVDTLATTVVPQGISIHEGAQGAQDNLCDPLAGCSTPEPSLFEGL